MSLDKSNFYGGLLMKYIKKYYILLILCLAALMIVFSMANRTTIKTEGFSADNVYNTTKTLSSGDYVGRRYGTRQNENTVKYIEGQFKSIGLQPAGQDGTYLRKYTQNTRVYNGTAVLEVVDKDGRIVKSYKYGEDFKEQSTGLSAPGNLTLEYKLIDYNGTEPQNVGGKSIAVINAADSKMLNSKQLIMDINRAGYSAAIITVPDNTNFRSDSAAIGERSGRTTGYETPTLLIKQKTFNELKSMENREYLVHMKSTFDVTPADISDVCGIIPAGNPKNNEYIFITAHLDGVGPDSDGTKYPGALDNASGVGTMLEIARFIKSQNTPPEKNIVFIAFNGGAGDLSGSHNYILYPAYPLYRSTVINLDTLGSGKDIPLTLMYYAPVDRSTGKEVDASSKLRHQFKEIAEKQGIKTEEVNEPSSDHAYFGAMKVPAITLTDRDTDKVRTPEDTIDNFGKENIERVLKLVTAYVSICAYSNISVSGYSIVYDEVASFLRVQSPLIAAFVLLLIVFYIVNYRKKSKNVQSKNRFPMFSITLFAVSCGIISYFPLDFLSSNTAVMETWRMLESGLLSILKSVIFIPIYAFFMGPGLLTLIFLNIKINNWRYQGTGKEFKIAYPISMVSVLIVSYISIGYFDKVKYMLLTPDFARYMSGRAVLFLSISAIAYLIYRLLAIETCMKTQTVKSFIVFSVIFTMLLCTFYIPIITDKTIINQNASSVTISVAGTGD